MRDKFPEFFKPDAAAIKAVWQTGIISIDASVLLDVYRYSENTRKELFRVFGQLGKRLWVAHTATREFLRARPDVIAGQADAYDKVEKELDALEANLKSARSHPFISTELLKEFSGMVSKVNTELRSRKAAVGELLEDDPILDDFPSYLRHAWETLLNRHESKKYAEKARSGIASWYRPGYKDSEKPGYRKYGDLLIWYELIDKARDSHLPLIFITSDAKEDWRVRHRGRTRGARPELIAEMRSKASVAFLLYSLESFLAAAKKYLDASITKKAIDEVKRSRKVATEPLPDVTAAVERYWQVVDQGRLAAEAARRHESLEEVRRAILSAPSFQAMQREMEAAEAMRRTALSNPVIEAMQREMKVADETRRSTLSNPAGRSRATRDESCRGNEAHCAEQSCGRSRAT